jgi:hypothetical protein
MFGIHFSQFFHFFGFMNTFFFLFVCFQMKYTRVEEVIGDVGEPLVVSFFPQEAWLIFSYLFQVIRIGKKNRLAALRAVLTIFALQDRRSTSDHC